MLYKLQNCRHKANLCNRKLMGYKNVYAMPQNKFENFKATLIERHRQVKIIEMENNIKTQRNNEIYKIVKKNSTIN